MMVAMRRMSSDCERFGNFRLNKILPDHTRRLPARKGISRINELLAITTGSSKKDDATFLLRKRRVASMSDIKDLFGDEMSCR